MPEALSPLQSLLRAPLLRTPLLGKLVAADLVVNGAAALAMQWTPSEYIAEASLASMVAVCILNGVLVVVALRPLAHVEDTARRVSEGEFGARTGLDPERTTFADRDVSRIGRTLDVLLDRITDDRARMRALAAEVVAAADRERARIARELHDSTAQSLSALDMLLATTAREHGDGPLSRRLAQMREVAGEALAEVRTLAQHVHPRVLDDLGLSAALQNLARRTRETASIAVELAVDGHRELPRDVAAALFRVAQEALHNAVKHGRPKRVDLRLELRDDEARLAITDDGVGFDRAATPGRVGGMGLFVMAERVALVDGRLAIEARPGAGTSVRVTVPLAGAGDEPAFGSDA